MRLFFGVQNIRSIKETSWIELKPITVLLGANNSGKSSFLRLFPLLRQSVTSANTPILWNSNISPSNISYGSYTSSVTDHKSEEDITFLFKVMDVNLHNEILQLADIKKECFVEYKFSEIEYNVVVGLAGRRTVLKKISCQIAEHEIEIEIKFKEGGYKVDTFKINGKDINNGVKTGFTEPLSVEIDTDSIFPTFRTRSREQLTRPGAIQPTITDFICLELFRLMTNPILERDTNPASKEDTYLANDMLVLDILKSPQFGKIELVKGKSNSENENVKDFYTSIKNDNITINNINFLCKTFWTFASLNAVSEIFREFFKENAYIQPDRVGGKRRYSFDDQNLSEIEPNGRNAPMILASFSEKEQTDFASWLKRMLDLKLKIKEESTGFRIEFDRGTSDVNFPYSGYGISQILPILTLLWQISNEETDDKILSRRDSFLLSVEVIKPITIEQPESHLHPKHQSIIADAMVFVLEEKSESLCPIFVIETHSKAFINRLGRLIEDKRISRNDVNVVLFSDKTQTFDSENRESIYEYCTIRETNFNKDGVLENWPLGFLG